MSNFYSRWRYCWKCQGKVPKFIFDWTLNLCPICWVKERISIYCRRLKLKRLFCRHKWEWVGMRMGVDDSYTDYYYCPRCYGHRHFTKKLPDVDAGLIQFIADDTVKESERLQREEGLTSNQAAKMVVWGNKEGVSSIRGFTKGG